MCVTLLGLAGILSDHGQERLARIWSFYFSVQDVSERHKISIQDAGLVLVLADRRSVEVNSCEKAPRSGIGQNFCLQFPVGVSTSIAAYWASSSGSIGTELKLAGQQVL